MYVINIIIIMIILYALIICAYGFSDVWRPTRLKPPCLFFVPLLVVASSLCGAGAPSLPLEVAAVATARGVHFPGDLPG